MERTLKTRVLAIIGAGVLLGSYLKWIRPWQLRWGACDAEVGRLMPGDDSVKEPTFDATRAVTVNARPEQIWPWLAQMGMNRAGWYSYDWIDNLGRPSAERLLPEFQHPQIGDLVPMSPDGKQGLFVKDFARDKWLLWWNGRGDTTWYWGLYPLDEKRTRLVTRIRVRYNWLHPSILFFLAMDVGDIVMLRRSLLNIKRRAEKLAGERS